MTREKLHRLTQECLTSGPRLAHQLVAYPIRIPARVTFGSVLLHVEKILLNMAMSDTLLAMTPACRLADQKPLACLLKRTPAGRTLDRELHMCMCNH